EVFVFPARLRVSPVDMKKVEPEIFQVLREPGRVRQSCSLIEAEIIGGPAPPSRWCSCNHAWMMQLPDQSSISLKLVEAVCPRADQQSLRRNLRSGSQRQLQFDLIFRRCVLQRILLLQFGRSSRIHLIGGNVIFVNVKTEHREKFL